MSKLICFGMGYSAMAVARCLAPQGWTIAGTSTTHEGVARLAASGFGAFHFDGEEPNLQIKQAVSDATHVLVSVPPDSAGDPVLRCHAADIAAAHDLRWIGYLSTIGVYGDRQGAWVDEETPANPGSERSRRRRSAENDWLALGAASGKTVQVFRLAGIYGPGRSVIDSLKNGTARRIIKPGQVFNRIHVDDITSVVIAAMEGRGRHAIYNVADNEPAPPQDVVAFGAELLGRVPPPEVTLEDAELSPMGRSFYAENKRVRSQRIKDDLGVTLRFPTYREGLKAVLEGNHGGMRLS